jgi:hypothetical protein
MSSIASALGFPTLVTAAVLLAANSLDHDVSLFHREKVNKAN